MKPLGFAVIVTAYLVVGYFASRDILVRIKKNWPRLPLDTGDFFLAIVLGGILWLIGWPTSFVGFPRHKGMSPGDSDEHY